MLMNHETKNIPCVNKSIPYRNFKQILSELSKESSIKNKVSNVKRCELNPYNQYLKNILDTGEKKEDTPTYFVMRASYEAMPENGIFDKTQIDSAKMNGGENTEYLFKFFGNSSIAK
jgi:hypothetical protein